MGKFNHFYKKILSYFILLYFCELVLAVILYFFLPENVPVHLGLTGVDAWGKGKYIIFLLPCSLILFCYICRSELIEQKYFLSPPAATLMKVFLCVIHLATTVGSVEYFYILIRLALE
ncbi:DUF1648 domain-containing protein [Liquorilactobacillus satsumensis]|uniref:DUF1648 domain-containing protein n=1 Tax=Liquorilactobacillus TaxID=2767888 RepID=UPI0007055508|nr:DUF1648 domain-containing protein [Liquorilactobacillus satsumensis]MCP9327595.1 DUF1648 domain-containing protein [Liquorilactobacillus satsumensis]MCP9359812.1 DUF1648 domain-containing protein [Liquorilactobacillus satsumensis]